MHDVPGQIGNDTVTDPEDWVDRYGDGLYRYALLRLGSPDLASDAVQETFLEALKAHRTFAGRSSERTWLVGILRHKVLDQFRRARRESAANDAAAEGQGKLPFDARGRWQTAPACWRGDPSRDMQNREFWDVLRRCIAKLPPGIADAFFLREIDGLAADEVQQLLGITAGNLWKRLHRARLQLRQCLESGWFG
jgi:RNA polymerase sigma-70 factor (ECF subfamily)